MHTGQVEILHGKQWPTAGSCHKLISQSAVSFGHAAKTSHNKAYDVTSTKKGPGDVLAKLSKVLRQATWDYMKKDLKATLKPTSGFIINNNNNVHLSCAHQCPERSHDTY